jgi:hypothetical protein
MENPEEDFDERRRRRRQKKVVERGRMEWDRLFIY